TWKKRRFGGVFENELREYKRREQFTDGQWNDYQNNELRRILVHAFETVPYYKDAFTKAGLGLSALSNLTVAELQRIPFLEKDTLRKFGTTTMLSSKLEKGGNFFASSGSTGTPTQILFSHPMHQ